MTNFQKKVSSKIVLKNVFSKIVFTQKNVLLAFFIGWVRCEARLMGGVEEQMMGLEGGVMGLWGHDKKGQMGEGDQRNGIVVGRGGCGGGGDIFSWAMPGTLLVLDRLIRVLHKLKFYVHIYGTCPTSQMVF
jgi:hypothetical protein